MGWWAWCAWTAGGESDQTRGGQLSRGRDRCGARVHEQRCAPKMHATAQRANSLGSPPSRPSPPPPNCRTGMHSGERSASTRDERPERAPACSFATSRCPPGRHCHPPPGAQCPMLQLDLAVAQQPSGWHPPRNRLHGYTGHWDDRLRVCASPFIRHVGRMGQAPSVAGAVLSHASAPHQALSR